MAEVSTKCTHNFALILYELIGMITQNEDCLILRLTQHLTENPFVNGASIASTSDHRRITIEPMIRLLGQ